MARINEFEIKSEKTFEGREGYGLSCNVFYKKKKIAHYCDVADGGSGRLAFEYDCKEEYRKALERAVAIYAINNPIECCVSLYNSERVVNEKERFLNRHPQLADLFTDEETAKKILSSYDTDLFINAIFELKQKEKAFKKYEKLGYDAMGEKREDMFSVSYCPVRTAWKLKGDEYEKIYYSIDEFNITLTA